MNKWKTPDTNEDPFDLSMETLLHRAEESERKNRGEMQELLLQAEQVERKHPIFQKVCSSQKKARKILLAVGLTFVIGIVSGGIDSNGGFQVGLWMQNRHGISYLKGETTDRYESNDINKKLREISEALDATLLQFKMEGKESVVCTKVNCNEQNKIANVDVRIGYEAYHIEIVKAKESTSYTISKDMKIVENIEINGGQEITICTWKDDEKEKNYYAYIVNGATMITIGTGASLEKLRKVLLMLAVE